jgi:hypothetical protein
MRQWAAKPAGLRASGFGLQGQIRSETTRRSVMGCAAPTYSPGLSSPGRPTKGSLQCPPSNSWLSSVGWDEVTPPGSPPGAQGWIHRIRRSNFGAWIRPQGLRHSERSRVFAAAIPLALATAPQRPPRSSTSSSMRALADPWATLSAPQKTPHPVDYTFRKTRPRTHWDPSLWDRAAEASDGPRAAA